MRIKDIHITLTRDRKLWSDYNGKSEEVTNLSIRDELIKIYRAFRTKRMSTAMKDKIYEDGLRKVRQLESFATDIQNGEVPEEIFTSTKHALTRVIDFFTEFSFEPNFRFVNTLCNYTVNNNLDDAREYIQNYFSLTDHQYANSINEKMKSHEFTSILAELQRLTVSKKINTRFKIYYGSQGTGKTTKAMQETANLVMVCHSAMLPSDLMEDFHFEDGHPIFKPSILQQSMVNGQKITLDEINLLPFESLRFLQSLLDSKTEITYKGKTIVIKDGFQIIGTMNLIVNGSVFSLPEPLVDRACELKQYKLTAGQLVGALI